MLIKNTCYVILMIFLVGCGSSKRVKREKPSGRTEPKVVTSEESSKETLESTSTTTVYKDVVKNYIATYQGIARRQMQAHGIPASIILAQGILESGAGRGELTRKANNHFGIKCHSDWTGPGVFHDDDRKGECFRKYDHPESSFNDHSLFLTGRSRYAFLFDLKKNDYKGWAHGLKKAGYATDPRYPAKLISIIERYRLYEYDAEVLGSPAPVYEDTYSYVVQKGDTLYSISKKYNLSVETIMQQNGLKDSTIKIGQELYLKR
ncbi:glucosaminidase domain-containing protein [Robertkochia aurantiaca]|uniref:glucosaminidase domain-containing protein n=1 Tax=Robertkochia aurantiaca TaxID=2873700 RepID=UPI001CCC7A45|nr:glucosaminidase domain-containing protein [Robertkochia sp. 3YJGBD-33]